MNSTHEPDPTFVRQLEWQVRTALRRRDRFARPVTLRPPRGLATAALVLFSVFLGAAGVVASERILDARAKELHLARARVQHDLAEARLASVTAEYARVQELHQAGVITGEERITREAALLAARIDRDTAALDIVEIEESGVAPRNDLAAPKVAGRDFVAERLWLELKPAEQAVDLANRRLDRLNALLANGLVGEREVRSVEGELIDAARRREGIARRLELRTRFLASEIAAERVDGLATLGEAQRELAAARRRLVSAIEEAEHVTAAAANGLVSEREQREAEFGVRELEARVRQLELEVEILSGDG